MTTHEQAVEAAKLTDQVHNTTPDVHSGTEGWWRHQAVLLARFILSLPPTPPASERLRELVVRCTGLKTNAMIDDLTAELSRLVAFPKEVVEAAQVIKRDGHGTHNAIFGTRPFEQCERYECTLARAILDRAGETDDGETVTPEFMKSVFGHELDPMQFDVTEEWWDGMIITVKFSTDAETVTAIKRKRKMAEVTCGEFRRLLTALGIDRAN